MKVFKKGEKVTVSFVDWLDLQNGLKPGTEGLYLEPCEGFLSLVTVLVDKREWYLHRQQLWEFDHHGSK